MSQWLEFYKLRPFGFYRESHLFGTLAAMYHNVHKTKGKDKSFTDIFPVDVTSKGADGRHTNEQIIEIFRQHNLDRGYTADGRRKPR